MSGAATTPKLNNPEAAAKMLADPYHLSPESLRVYRRLWQLETWLRETTYVELKSAHGLAGMKGDRHEGPRGKPFSRPPRLHSKAG
jgi:hypothetical protein